MFGGTLGSAAAAAAILAADFVALTLFLNPEIRLRGEAGALLVSFFLPYLVLGTAPLALLGFLFPALSGGARASPPLLSGLPFFPRPPFPAPSPPPPPSPLNLPPSP